MLQETSEDWEECEALINALLNDQEKAAINQHPIWSLDPPQRESYLTPTTYALGMKRYAKKVIEHNNRLQSTGANSHACE